MTPEESLYAKLLGETAAITWPELERFFANGSLLWVRGDEDLIAIAQGVAEDDKAKVAQWLERGALKRLEAEEAKDWQSRQPELWAVVVSPWILVQERSGAPTRH